MKIELMDGMTERENRTIYILGNGFDRTHGLNTKPEDFLEILKTQSIYNELDTAKQVFENYSVFWGNYEECLAEIDLESIKENQLIFPDYLSDHEYDRDAGIFNMEVYTDSLRRAVHNSLKIMVDNANDSLSQTKPVLRNFLKSKDVVLSFNYTSTLEQLYDIPDDVTICHIHGYRAANESLLFGFRDGIDEKEYYNRHFDVDEIRMIEKQISNILEDDSLTKEEKEHELVYWKICYDNLTGHRDFYIDKQIEIIFDFYQSMKKEIQLGKLKSFLENSDGINQVVVMGHSMSSVDSEYMELIESVIVPDKWRISQYNGSPSYNDLASYSFSKKVEFFNLKNEYSNE